MITGDLKVPVLRGTKVLFVFENDRGIISSLSSRYNLTVRVRGFGLSVSQLSLVLVGAYTVRG